MSRRRTRQERWAFNYPDKAADKRKGSQHNREKARSVAGMTHPLEQDYHAKCARVYQNLNKAGFVTPRKRNGSFYIIGDPPEKMRKFPPRKTV